MDEIPFRSTLYQVPLSACQSNSTLTRENKNSEQTQSLFIFFKKWEEAERKTNKPNKRNSRFVRDVLDGSSRRQAMGDPPPDIDLQVRSIAMFLNSPTELPATEVQASVVAGASHDGTEVQALVVTWASHDGTAAVHHPYAVRPCSSISQAKSSGRWNSRMDILH